TAKSAKIDWRSGILIEHDLFGKPVPTFPDHALSNLPRFGPGLQRSPQTAIEPEAIDWCRGIDGADAAQLDTRPLEATLLQPAPRRRVADTRPRLQRLMAELAEAVIDHGANCFSRVASIPERHADPIAELSSLRPHIDAAGTDHRAIKHDGEC